MNAADFANIGQSGWKPPVTPHVALDLPIHPEAQEIQQLAQRTGTNAMQAGFLHGLRQVADPAERMGAWLAHNRYTNELATKLGIPTDQALQAEQQASNAHYQQQYGGRMAAQVGSLGGQLTASVPLVEGGEALGAGLLGKAGVAPEALNFLRGEGTGNLFQRMGSSMVHGGLQGTAYGGLAGGLPSTVDGAGVGLALGAAGVPAEGAARALGDGMDRMFVSNGRYASNKLLGALKADGVGPAQALARMQMLGSQAAPLDMGTPAVTRLAERTVAKGGTGGSVITQMLDDRAGTARDALLDAVTHSTGAKGDFGQALKDLQDQRASEAAPLYHKALQTPGKSPFIDKVLEDEDHGKIAAKGLKDLRTEALADGTEGVPETPMTQYHALKVGLDDAIGKAKRAGENNSARTLVKLQKRVVSEMDSLSPDYQAARQSYAGHSASMDAMESGRTALKQHPDDVKRIVSGLSPSDQPFFRLGLAENMRDNINGMAENRDASYASMKTPRMRQALANAFASPEDFQQFEQAAEAQRQFATSRNEITKGSQTARRLSDPDSDLLPHIHALARGDHIGGLTGLARLGLSHAAAGDPKLEALGRLLATQDPYVIQNALTSPGQGLIPRALKGVGRGAAYLPLPVAVQGTTNLLGQ